MRSRMIQWIGALALCAAAATVATGQLANTPWPSFQRDAQNTGMAAPGAPGIQYPALRWQHTIGDGGKWENQGNPAVGNGVVYAVSNENKIMAIESSGSILWTRTLSSDVQAGPALTADGFLYVATGFGDAGESNVFYKVNAATGDIADQFNYPGATGYNNLGAPVVDSDGDVYFPSEGPNFFWCLDSALAEQWSYDPTDGGSVSAGAGGSPALSHDESVVYFTTSDDSRSLFAMDTATGGTNWVFQADGFFWSSGPMVGADGTIYMGDAEGIVYAITDNGATSTEKWRLELGLGGINGNLGGYHDVGGTPRFYASPNGDGFLVAIDDLGASGDAVWTFDTGSGGWSYPSPVATDDGTVYVSSPSDGRIYALKDLGTSYELRWAESYAGVAPGTRGLAIDADGTLYINSKDGNLYAIEEGDGPPPTIYTTDFDTGYTPGTVNGQDGWVVTVGDPSQAQIQAGTSVSGQALCLDASADIAVERALPNYVALGYKRVVLEYDVYLTGAPALSGGLNLVDPMVGDAVSTYWQAAGVVGDVYDVPMDAQINIGRANTQSPDGDALYIPNFVSPLDTLEFRADEAEGYARHYLDGGGSGSWWYGPYVDFYLAGFTDDYIDITGLALEFDTRYFQDPDTNTNPYGDAPVFVRFYSYEDDGSGTYPTYLGHRDYSIVYATQRGDDPYPTWTHVIVDLNDPGAYTEGGTFDPAKVSRMRFYGTDWSGGGDDFVDVKKFYVGPSGAIATEIFADQGNDGTNESADHMVPGYNADRWYHVKQVLDYAAKRLTSMTVDDAGETGPTDIYFRKYAGETAAGAGKVVIHLDNEGGDDGVCIDNLSVTTLARFGITDITRTVDGPFIEWNYQAPGNFVVERADAPGQPWSDASIPLIGLTSWTDESDPDPDAVYRVALYDQAPESEAFFDDFDPGPGGWTTSGANVSWAVGSPTEYTGTNGAPTSAYSGSSCWATGLSSDYNSDEASSLVSPVIDLTSKVQATLTFQEFVSTEGVDFDWVELEVWDSDAAAKLATIVPARGGFVGGWAEQSVSLADGVGKNIQLKFLMNADDSIEASGWYIDDVLVTTVP